MSSRSSYLDILDAAWQQHTAPRESNAPTVISTFAGCGGSSLGYSMAGFRELLAVEWDQNAVDTFRLNFPDVPVYHGDIAALSVADCLERTGLQPGELDVFDGSPPCQGFSTAGKRALDDPRNQLFREYVRLLRGLQPKVFVMENVSGMVKGKMKLIFADILRELKTSGYQVSARLMNAMYFNVPQSRERMIFIGVRNDLGIAPSHPKGGRITTVGEAWQGVSDTTPIMGLGWLKDYVQGWPAGTGLGAVAIKRRPDLGKFGQHGNANKRLTFNSASNTVSKLFSASKLIHPIQDRVISHQELTRIGSFPDPYTWLDKKSATERIGNSVPPLFMRAIAEHIRSEILERIETTPMS
ncbi:MAG TPA: DNA cytosine methyltransferase [Roseiflexaceae bacterium]|nr:DNA cytosine methyltransferase [Roseiflexaceae bacterium]